MCHKNPLNVPENILIKELLLFKSETPQRGTNTAWPTANMPNQYSLANSKHSQTNTAWPAANMPNPAWWETNSSSLQTQQISDHHTASAKVFKRQRSYFFESQTNKAYGIKEKYMFLLQSLSRNSLSPKYLCSKHHVNFRHSKKFV